MIEITHKHTGFEIRAIFGQLQLVSRLELLVLARQIRFEIESLQQQMFLIAYPTPVQTQYVSLSQGYDPIRPHPPPCLPNFDGDIQPEEKKN